MSILHAEHTGQHLALYRSGLTPALVTQCAATDQRPYIHPILAPDGVGELTENQPGHHLWQHGLYVGLNDMNGVGFWKEGYGGSPHDGTFHPQPLAPPVVSGNQARWEVTTEWRAPDGSPLLTETQKWSLEDRGDSMALDLTWGLRAETDLRFGKHSYGGLFLRMPWRAETGGDILTSEGHAGTDAAEGKRARWVALGRAGDADSRSRLRGCRHRPAGPPVEPGTPRAVAGGRQFRHRAEPCIAGEWRLARGGSTVSRYRVFAFTGPISRDAVESEWLQFATA